MKISKREMIMLIGLGIILFCFGYYELIYTNQVEKINELNKKLEEYENIQLIGKVQASPKNNIYKNLEKLNSKTYHITQSYFPRIIQEKIILLINGLIDKSEINLISISFSEIENGIAEKKEEEDKEINVLEEYIKTYKEMSDAMKHKEEEKKEEKPKQETTEERIIKQIKRITATLTFEGTYDEVSEFIAETEALNRKILITKLNLIKIDDKNIKGTIALDFYAIPKFHQQDDGYTKWDIVDNYGKSNPFSPFNDYSQNDSSILNKVADFKMSLSPETADIPTVIIGRDKDPEAKTYVYGENPGFEKVDFEIYKEGSNYYYRYRTESESYPQNYDGDRVSFEPSNNKVKLSITSSKRVSDSDKSGVNLSIINNTDLSLEVETFNDDEKKPRIKVLTTKGDVLVK